MDRRLEFGIVVDWDGRKLGIEEASFLTGKLPTRV